MQTLEPKALKDVIRLRHELHKRPELALQEEMTAQAIADWFFVLEPDEILTGLGGHGVAIVYNGKSPGKTVLLRCELDALPILEANYFDYRSLTDRVSHKCGHDGHMAILAALGTLLSDERPLSGRVILLFQPAEETGEGARKVMADERFKKLKPDFVFALHNLPGYPLGQVLLRRSIFNCASVGMFVRLSGRTAHAAHPENGASPLNALAAILPTISDISALEAPAIVNLRGFYSLVTVTHVRLGEPSFGVYPGIAEFMVAIRAETEDNLSKIAEAATLFVRNQARTHGLRCEIEWRERVRANHSHAESCDLIERAAGAAGLAVTEIEEPIRWSEDFGEFTTRFRGAMFGLGSGENQPPLLSPDFDFPDGLIPPGVAIFRSIIEEILNR